MMGIGSIVCSGGVAALFIAGGAGLTLARWMLDHDPKKKMRNEFN